MNYPLGKILANRGFHVLLRLATRLPVRDISNNLKLYRRSILDDLDIVEDGFAANAEVGLAPFLGGYAVEEIPISWIGRTPDMGRTSFDIVRAAPGYWRVLVRMSERREHSGHVPPTEAVGRATVGPSGSRRAAEVATLAVAALAYLTATAWLAVRDQLWNDELFTYYFAHLPDFGSLWDQLSTGVEQTPPLYYAITRGALRAFGDNNIALRLPGLLGVLVACACLYTFVARRSSMTLWVDRSADRPQLPGRFLRARGAPLWRGSGLRGGGAPLLAAPRRAGRWRIRRRGNDPQSHLGGGVPLLRSADLGALGTW